MQELDIIKTFKQMCGSRTETGYALNVGDIAVPVFIETDHDLSMPEILIRPFITDVRLAKTTIQCGTQENPTRSDIEFKHARFQVDIYSSNLIELIKIKTALQNRLDDFEEVELIVFSETTGWQQYDTHVYLNDGYDSTRGIVKIKDPLALFEKKETLEEVSTSPGSWYLDDTGLYVYPLNDLQSIEIFELLNGLVFEDGSTMFDKGIHQIRASMSRKTRDDEPGAERWVIDYMVTYRILRQKKLGTKLEEINLNVQED